MDRNRPCEGTLTQTDGYSFNVTYAKQCHDLMSYFKPKPKSKIPMQGGNRQPRGGSTKSADRMAVDSQASSCEDTETQETIPREGTLETFPQEETLHSLEIAPPVEYRHSGQLKKYLLSDLPDALLNLVYSFAPHCVLLHLSTCRRFNDVLPQSDKVALGHRDFFGDPRHAKCVACKAAASGSCLHGQIQRKCVACLHGQIQRFSGFLQLRLCDPGGFLLRKVRRARACWRVEALDLTSSKIGRIDAGQGGP